jgi:hypothetical protein
MEINISQADLVRAIRMFAQIEKRAALQADAPRRDDSADVVLKKVAKKYGIPLSESGATAGKKKGR